MSLTGHGLQMAGCRWNPRPVTGNTAALPLFRVEQKPIVAPSFPWRTDVLSDILVCSVILAACLPLSRPACCSEAEGRQLGERAGRPGGRGLRPS